MKKISFFVQFIFSLLPFLSFGSNKDTNKVNPTTDISINAGIGIPFGGYSYYQYALLGPFVNTSATIPIKHSRFGIVGLLGFGSNRCANAIAIYVNQPTSLVKGNFYMANVMAGVFYKVPHKNTSIEFRLLGGALYFKTPSITYTGESYAQSVYYYYYSGTWVVNGENSFSFAIDIGSSIKWNFAKRLFGSLNVDFLYCGLNGGYYSATQFTPAYSWFGPSYTSKYSYLYSSVSLINLSIGIGYNL